MAMSLPSKSSDRRVLSEINVTPLVDVMLVLLVIFMVTTPLLQRGTDVQLPQAQHSDVREERRTTLPLTREGRLYLDEQEIPRSALRERLAALAKTEGRQIYFRGDAQVPYGLVIEVMDALKGAGIETVGMVTEPVSAQPRRE